jgi:large subunit ribosomal protein L3
LDSSVRQNFKEEFSMTIGVVARKCGMSQIFTPEGGAIPVTVVEVTPNRVTQIKTQERDGYRAVQVTTGQKRAIRVNKPTSGHLAKAKVEAGRGFWEFPLSEEEASQIQVGQEIKLDVFQVGQKIDVSGVTRGKGFAGVIKRHHFESQDASHGNSLSHRAPGSIGQNQSPGRVFKGKRMAGHLGNVRRTIQNVEVAAIDSQRNLLMIKGAVPGSPGGDLLVRPAVKSRASTTA